jgi:hypothetical protein
MIISMPTPARPQQWFRTPLSLRRQLMEDDGERPAA